MTSEKSKTTAVLLALFLGGWGAHRFYAGKTGTAIIMFVLTLTIVGAFATAIWAWIDIAVIASGKFTDQNGYLIKE